VLEVIDKGNVTESHSVPLLFVHGALHAAWCWDEHFLDWFADRGYRAVALSLRSHGSPVSQPLNTYTIADYVDDVRSVVDDLPTTPVSIGHSMGGFIVQKFLESSAALAGVMLSSAPPRTWLREMLPYNLRQPLAHRDNELDPQATDPAPRPGNVAGAFVQPEHPRTRRRAVLQATPG
jgi:pimeloyl-ACP methyl ester carboxylesterase